MESRLGVESRLSSTEVGGTVVEAAGCSGFLAASSERELGESISCVGGKMY